MKSEPSEFSIDDLRLNKREMWDGIRNYQVRNMLRDEMKKGDLALFYHSNSGSLTGMVGVMEIAKEAYPDPTQFDKNSAHPDLKSNPDNPRWLCVDVKFKKKLPRVITLTELKKQKWLASTPLLRKGNRLSVSSLTKDQFNHILNLAKK